MIHRQAAGGFVLFSVLLSAWGTVIRIPDSSSPEEWSEIKLEWADPETDLDPAEFLTKVHFPSDEDFTVHQISRSLLMVTKDLVSYAARSKYTGQTLSIEEKLFHLQDIKPEDVKQLLAYQAIAIPNAHNITCDYGTQYYRTMDGRCNNLHNPCWGKAEEPYQRWLPAVYGNGIDELRKQRNGYPLPNARLVYLWVSSQFEQSSETTYPLLSNLIVVWGQMVAHDVALTPTVTVKVWDGKELKDEKPKCCDPQNSHPDCMPIQLDYEDGYYSKGHCMNVARSVAYVYSPNSCSPLLLGKTREQMDQITSYLDASLVYGSSVKEMLALREDHGRSANLIMDYSTGWSYPARKNSTCKSSASSCNKNCFLAGERRANESPILGSMHTLWAREHNRLVGLLRSRGWPEETLFHVVRKIIGALLQHLTYKEYLPTVLGSTLSDSMKLSVPTEEYRYDPSINPTIYNAFATAAFRYGHSMVSARHLRRGKSYDASPVLSQDFFSMDDFCNPQGDPVAHILDGQLQQKAQKVDCLFSKQVTNHLFAKQPNGEGLDLFSLNIQRGRDHGLPPYNKWREACGLPVAKDYPDLKGTMPDYVVDRLSKIYGPGNVDEVDLYVGGVSEYPVNDGILGSTFTCIVSNQFRNLKFGDRFWYENTDHPGAFTTAQIASIQKSTIASLLCRNIDIQMVQQKALLFESPQNPKLSCDAILQQTDLDLNLW